MYILTMERTRKDFSELYNCLKETEKIIKSGINFQETMYLKNLFYVRGDWKHDN